MAGLGSSAGLDSDILGTVATQVFQENKKKTENFYRLKKQKRTLINKLNALRNFISI